MSIQPSLRDGPCGKQLIEALHTLVRNMRELPDEYADYHDIFSEWQKWLYTGWKEGEPMVSYLAAEYCRHSPEYDVVFDNSLAGGPASAEKIYLDAAEQGCDLAHLWLAYCYEEGRCGLVKKPEAFARHLSQVSEPFPVDGLFCVDDLAFLYDELDGLYDLTEKALYSWDQYRDPCFSTLNDRSVLLYGYMVMLGLRNVPRHERKSPLDVYHPSMEWNPAYDELNAKNSQEKADWEAWRKQRQIRK